MRTPEQSVRLYTAGSLNPSRMKAADHKAQARGSGPRYEARDVAAVAAPLSPARASPRRDDSPLVRTLRCANETLAPPVGPTQISAARLL